MHHVGDDIDNHPIVRNLVQAQLSHGSCRPTAMPVSVAQKVYTDSHSMGSSARTKQSPHCLAVPADYPMHASTTYSAFLARGSFSVIDLQEQGEHFPTPFHLISGLSLDVNFVTHDRLQVFYCIWDLCISDGTALFECARLRIYPTTRRLLWFATSGIE